MPSWAQVEAEARELTELARRLFDAHVHKTIATLRRDGSPRISGIEVQFRDGDLFFGSMPGGVKATDLRRDPRFALHSGSDDPPGWPGDAKVAGRADEVEAEGMHLFRADITELVVVRLNESRDRLVIEAWHEGRGVSRMTRT